MKELRIVAAIHIRISRLLCGARESTARIGSLHTDAQSSSYLQNVPLHLLPQKRLEVTGAVTFCSLVQSSEELFGTS